MSSMRVAIGLWLVAKVYTTKKPQTNAEHDDFYFLLMYNFRKVVQTNKKQKMEAIKVLA